MNYKERISALKSFKRAVSSGETTDSISGISTEISDWSGYANTKFDDYVDTIQKDCKTLAGRKTEFLAAIDTIISNIQSQFDYEYSTYSYILSTTYNSKSASKNKSLKISAINNLWIDESVKAALKSHL